MSAEVRGSAACVTRTGLSKKAWPSRQAAVRASRLVQAHIGRTEVYRCATCGLYHIGHGSWR